MSKSLGNIRDPNTFADTFGIEPLRYYLMRDCVVGQDMDFTDRGMIQRYNSDLANGLGNLLNRTLNMAQKYRAGKLSRMGRQSSLEGEDPPEISPALSGGSAGAPVETGAQLARRSSLAVANFRSAADQNLIHSALEQVEQLVTSCNQMIDYMAPWRLAKDPQKAELLESILYELAESLRIIAILISPVLPGAAARIFEQLNWTGPKTLQEATWGKLPDGHRFGKPVPLFPRIEWAEGAAESGRSQGEAQERPRKGEIR